MNEEFQEWTEYDWAWYHETLFPTGKLVEEDLHLIKLYSPYRRCDEFLGYAQTLLNGGVLVELEWCTWCNEVVPIILKARRGYKAQWTPSFEDYAN